MKTLRLASLTAAVLFSSSAMANVVTDAGNTIVESGKTVFTTLAKPGAINAEIGTLGYGASIAWSANESTEVVAGWNGGSFDMDTDIGGSDSIINWKKVLGSEWDNYQGQLKLDGDYSNPYVGVNVRPWKNSVTVGTGVIFQDNSLDASLVTTGNTNANIKIDGQEYDVDGTVKVKAESGNTLAPYLTVGVKPNMNNNSRLGFFGEVGAAYTGKWKTEVDLTEATVANAPKDQLQDDLERTIRDNNPTWYPIVKVGATYRF